MISMPTQPTFGQINVSRMEVTPRSGYNNYTGQFQLDLEVTGQDAKKFAPLLSGKDKVSLRQYGNSFWVNQTPLDQKTVWKGYPSTKHLHRVPRSFVRLVSQLIKAAPLTQDLKTNLNNQLKKASGWGTVDGKPTELKEITYHTVTKEIKLPLHIDN